MGVPQRLLLFGPRSYSALNLSASSVAEDAATGTVVGGILGKAPGSTVTLVDSASGKFALDGTNIEVAGALDYETATSHNITLRETIPGRGPRDTTVTIAVTDVSEGSAQLYPQPTFDSSTGLTLNGWSVSGGAAHSNSSGGTMRATATETLTTGIYDVVLTGVSASGLFDVLVAGQSCSPTGSGTFQAVVVSVVSQFIDVADSEGDTVNIGGLEVYKVA